MIKLARKTRKQLYENNKGADQPANPHSLIIACYLVSCRQNTYNILISQLVSIAEQTGSILTWSKIFWEDFFAKRLLSPSRHTAFKQRRINVDATSWRHDVTSTSIRRCFDVM